MKSIFTLFSVLFVSGSVWAGNVLHLQNQSLNTDRLVQMFSGNIQAPKVYVIQFKEKVTQSLKNELQARGVKVYRYLPDDALVVRASYSELLQFQPEKVQAILPFKAEFKMASNLPKLSVFSVQQRTQIYVRVFESEGADRLIEKALSLDPQTIVLDQNERGVVLSVNQSLIPELAAMEDVEYVQKTEKLTPMHMVFEDLEEPPVNRVLGDYTDLDGNETGVKISGFEKAWAHGLTGAEQIVAMADTGLDSGNPSTIHSTFRDAVVSGYSFGVGAQSWEDPMGHGTHVAGSVMMRGGPSGDKLLGGAFQAKILPQGMWSPIIDNLTVPPKLNRLFETAYADGARIHTNSWGSPRNLGAYDGMAAQVDEFMWENPDFLILFAAGNSGADLDKDGVIDHGSVSSPGTAKNALTVGASENNTDLGGIQVPISKLRSAKDAWPAEPIHSSLVSDNENGIAMFSSRGPTQDGRLKPEIVAPGTNILSVKSQHPNAMEMWGLYNNDYAWSGGTSMATPIVAGAAAVVRQYLAEKFEVLTPSAALVKAVLMNTAFDLYPGQYGEGTSTQELKTQRPNMDQGYGRLDMDRLVGLRKSSKLIDHTEGLGVGEVFEQKIRIKAGERLVVNLVYTDAPGSPAAGKALVNNLDLRVYNTAKSIELLSSDSVNNAEFVEVKAALGGTYTVEVSGVNVPMGRNGKQPFALVVTSFPQ